MQKNTIPIYNLATLPSKKAVTRSQGGPVVPLGNVAKKPTTLDHKARNDAARRRFQLQDTAATLLPKERVSHCLRRMVQTSSGVTCKHVVGSDTAVFAGLQTCSSVWMCPLCASKITERRRVDELQVALKAAHDAGSNLRVVMITLTFEHHQHQPLIGLLHDLMEAHKSYQSGGVVTRLKEQFGILGTIRALEVTYGLSNGWHPHLHLLVFLDRSADIAAYGKAARKLWERSLTKHGLRCNEHGFRLDDCDSRVADYIAKFGKEPEDETKRAWDERWNEANEMSKWHMKKGRGSALGEDEHVTPFGLLGYATDGDKPAAALFYEYAQAFKGRQQLKWSKDLKAHFGIVEKTDEEIAEEQEEHTDLEVALTPQAWRVILREKARFDLQRMVGGADPELLYAFLDGLGIAANPLNGRMDARIYWYQDEPAV